MPGQGRVVKRPYTASERAALGEAARTPGDTASTPNNRVETGGTSNTPATPASTSHVDAETGKTAAVLGDTTFDIYLNDRAYWRNVPAAVWNSTSSEATRSSRSGSPTEKAPSWAVPSNPKKSTTSPTPPAA